MVTSILVENLPDEVVAALQKSAASSNRSLEAECRRVLCAWLEPMPWQGDRSARRHEVAQRLAEALRQANAARKGEPLRPSHIAAAIGCDRVETVERWFGGEEEPSIGELEGLAAYFGVRGDWLLHGDGAPYCATFSELPINPKAGVRWLLEPDPTYGRTTAIRFVRNGSRKGELAVVREFEGGRARVCNTGCDVSDPLEGRPVAIRFVSAGSGKDRVPVLMEIDERGASVESLDFNVSGLIGRRDEARLAALSALLHLLHQCFLDMPGAGFRVTSHVAPPAVYTKLILGQANPVALVAALQNTPWWEDFWDRRQIAKGESLGHWRGWSRTAARIAAVVDCDAALSVQRARIASHGHLLIAGGAADEDGGGFARRHQAGQASPPGV